MSKELIYMITASDLSVLNGPVVHFTEVADAFASEGRHVLGVAPGPGRFHRELQCQIKYLNTLIPFIPRNLSFQFELFLLLIKACFKRELSLIYVRHSSYMLVPQILCFFFRIKCIVEINGIAKTHYKLTRKNYFYRLFTFFTESLSLKLADKIIAVTKGMKCEIIQYHKTKADKIKVISNGVNTELYRKSEVKDNCYKEYGANNILVYVGSLEKWQGLDLLTEAVNEIRKGTHDFRVIIIGTGSYEKEISREINQKELSEYFHFMGEKKENQIIEILSYADIALLPIYSKDKIYHASFMKLYTYLSLSLPVIAPEVEQTKILEDYNCGIRVKPNNHKEFAAAVIRLLQNKEKIKEMGKNGRELMVEKYDWKQLYRNIPDL